MTIKTWALVYLVGNTLHGLSKSMNSWGIKLLFLFFFTEQTSSANACTDVFVHCLLVFKIAKYLCWLILAVDYCVAYLSFIDLLMFWSSTPIIFVVIFSYHFICVT
jgi:hypothetical protein